MSRTLDAATLSAINSRTVSPVYLVEMGFTTPVRYSTKETINWGGYNWTAASMRVAMNKNPSIAVFNEGTTFGDTVLTDGVSGREIKIYSAFEYTKRNLLTYTEVLDNSVWTKTNVSVSVDAGVNPAGNQNADRVDASAAGSYVEYNSAFTGNHTFAVYVKAPSGTVDGEINWSGADASAFTATAEWQRVSTAANVTGAKPRVVIDTISEQLYVWGAQVETGLAETEYQPVIAGSYTPTGSEPTGYTAPILLFDGEMAAATIRDVVSISCKEFPPLYTPRHFVSEPIFNHVPAVGTRFVTPQGVIILEGR